MSKSISYVERILKGSFYLPYLLVEDSFPSVGQWIIKKWSVQLSKKKSKKCVIILTEPSLKLIFDSLHDPDSLAVVYLEKFSTIQEFFQHIVKVISEYKLNNFSTFFILDLSTAFLLSEKANANLNITPVIHAVHEFEKFKAHHVEVICFVKTDLISDIHQEQLRHIFCSFISLKGLYPPKKGSCTIAPVNMHLSLLTENKNRKDENCILNFDFNETTDFIINQETSSNKKPSSVDISDNLDRTMRQLSTFNVSMTDKQKEDRARVELPYLKAQEHSGDKMPSIIYHHEINDDQDDDDPDADLEI